jgi:DNA-directed RNA polymerase I subunit RPA12
MRSSDTGAKIIVTQSKPSDFPSFLRQKLQSSVQAVERHTLNTESTVRERCPNCGREEVKYTTVQLRSADEGSTVIYNCECGNSWHENN